MIREAVVRQRECRSGQRISDFEIILAPAHLPDITPRGRAVIDKRFVDELADFVRPGVDVLDRRAEDAGMRLPGCTSLPLKYTFESQALCKK